MTAWRRGVIINKSLCVCVCPSPSRVWRKARAMYTPHSGFQMVNQNIKRNEWQGKARKSAIGGLILHRYMRKGKRPPSHTHLPNVTKSVFAFSSYAYKILATLQPSIPTPGVEISQAHLDAWSQAPQNLNLDIWNHLPPPPPLLFNFLCTYTTYSLHG